jgi:hypothetical protein
MNLAHAALTKMLDEFFWALRRAGLEISTAQAIDAVRAAALVGFDRATLESTLQLLLCTRRAELATFGMTFTRFFSHQAPPRSQRERLEAAGLREDEIELIARLLAEADPAARAAFEADAFVDRHMAEGLGLVPRAPLQVGFHTQRALRALGHHAVSGKLAMMREAIAAAYGEERAELIVRLLMSEQQRHEREVRETFRRHAEAELVRARTFTTTPLTELQPAQVARARRALREFAEGLVRAAQARDRARRRSRLQFARTLRASLATDGVPLHLYYRGPRRARPKLLVLCDISDSVRAAASFFLELTYVAQQMWRSTRTFLFVSDVAESSALFRAHAFPEAVSRALSGEVVPTHHISNYGRVFERFLADVGASITRDTTLLILGDGRTNYGARGEDALRALVSKSGRTYWLATEREEAWTSGDSALARYARIVHRAFPATCLDDFEKAARAIAR